MWQILENNIKTLLQSAERDYDQFFGKSEDKGVQELTLSDLQKIAEVFEIEISDLLFRSLFNQQSIAEKLSQIRLLVLDVDGVMTDGGMYVAENGDQFKKFNTKDGMGILNLTKQNFQVAIISSGFVSEAVNQRAKLLGIQHCVVSRRNKLEVLDELLEKLNLQRNQVAMLGDDINDLEIIKAVAIAACPKDAVKEVQQQCQIVLNTLGGHGCVREFIDQHLKPYIT